MKKTITALTATLALSFNAHADLIEDCKTVERMARGIMEVRQLGVTPSDLMKAFPKNAILPASTIKVMRQAYAWPIVPTKSLQEAINDFGEIMFLACMDGET